MAGHGSSHEGRMTDGVEFPFLVKSRAHQRRTNPWRGSSGSDSPLLARDMDYSPEGQRQLPPLDCTPTRLEECKDSSNSLSEYLIYLHFKAIIFLGLY
ncbi:hypothetical protein CEXT_67511 [Caerostris extrusa]|uniref:Uncharacterized protein n=1 Tax=Caerostris extrusa TaxID=172846 RepID=A0AAV4XRS7_CAEEX|nr:hypothetical protein CEXT_67511 [Caerostris extrusa]